MSAETLKIDQIEETLPTLPMACESDNAQRFISHFKQGTEISCYKLIALMNYTANSELWFCSDSFGYTCVTKLSREVDDPAMIQRISELKSEYLVDIHEFGKYEGYWYEIFPYYKYGPLTAGMSTEQIREFVLPGIVKALEVLHKEGIVHNDIKPANIYWNNEHDGIVIGDFGSACEENKKPKRCTPAYAAPELLLGNPCTKESDWVSVGLTLATLVNGEELIKAETYRQAERAWERKVVFSSDDASFRQLVNGMINDNSKRRLGSYAALKWCDNKIFGAESHVVNNPVKEKELPMIRFTDPDRIVYDGKGLIEAFAEHWDYSVFLMGQSKIEEFLKKADKRFYEFCRELKKLSDGEDAVYKLSLELSDGAVFVWRGKKYRNLLEMEDTWDMNTDGRRDIADFIQRAQDPPNNP